jgi:hypothetical protein
MATFNEYLNNYTTATAKESAAERAKRVQQELAKAKKLKFAARNEQQKEAELNAFLNASTAASELLRVIGGVQRGSVSKKEAEKVFQTYQNTVQILRKLNPQKAMAVDKVFKTTPKPETPAELGRNYYTGRGTKQNLFLQNGKPFTGTYNNRKYKDGIDLSLSAEEAAATTSAESAKAKKDAEDAAKVAKAKADAKARASADGTDGGDTTPKVVGDLTTPGKATGEQGPGVGVRDALKIPGRAESAFQELLAKTDFNFNLPDYIFTVDRDKKTGELGQLGKLLLKAVEKGYTEKQFLDEAMLTDWWQSNAGSVRERIIGLNKYKELQKKGLDVSKTEFGMYQTEKMRQVKDRAKRLANIELDDATAQKIVEDIYNGFLDNDPLAIDRLIIPYVGKTTNLYGAGGKVTGYAGEALQIQQSLSAIAKANGLDIKTILPKFGAVGAGQDAEQIAIQKILSGDIDLNTVLQNARTLAAAGQPKYVRDLLAAGYNLDDVYAPYKKQMAATLELNPDEIDLNDSTLRLAISDQGDMNLYDFKKALRKDSRWQYTEGARAEVADSALRILRDFGFQG